MLGNNIFQEVAIVSGTGIEKISREMIRSIWKRRVKSAVRSSLETKKDFLRGHLRKRRKVRPRKKLRTFEFKTFSQESWQTNL